MPFAVTNCEGHLLWTQVSAYGHVTKKIKTAGNLRILSKKIPAACATGIYKHQETRNYSASAMTSFTSGIMRFIMPSMPLFSVIIDEGQPEQEPCIIRFTTPSL